MYLSTRVRAVCFSCSTMELQMTDFENSAFVVFIVLLTRAIVSFNLNMYIPISKV